MKTPEEVLRQVALDEIQFDHGGGPGVINRATFEELCRTYRGRVTGVSVAVFEPTLKQLRRVYKMLGSEGTYTAWADHFFSFMSIVRFGSVYEVNAEIKRHRDRLALSIPSPR